MKILTIGNSFTWSLRSCFPAIAEAQGEELKLEFANFGGCEFRRHWAYITAEENEPCCKMYKEYTMKLRELLASDDWDVVTVQSASHESWDYANYTPFAGLIIDYVKKHAPGAKIIIQQTWAYREDAPRLAEWGFDRNEMYRRLDQAYRKLGTEYNLPIIPTGKGVELAIANDPNGNTTEDGHTATDDTSNPSHDLSREPLDTTPEKAAGILPWIIGALVLLSIVLVVLALIPKKRQSR